MKKHSRITRNYALWLSLFLLAVLILGAAAAALQERGVNPRADFWGAVREGIPGYTTALSEAHAVLIQNGGQNWREIRNGPLAGISPWVLAAVFGVIMIFFLIVGQDKLEEPRSGIRIKRFSLAERILHWVTASFFILLALTGLSNLFGRAVLIPVFGQAPFAAYMQWALWIHNVSGPLFLAGLLIEFIVWVKDNIPRKMDLVWFKKMGGMVGKGPRPHAGKVNGGEKAWFWLMILAGIAVGVTGVILDFPIWGQSRPTMQLAHVIHATVGILFVAASFGHIYIGTIGAEGTFEGMWRGSVDAVWAKQHEDLWYEQKMKAE
ncbi:MAG: formate dehydrogenase subunit gamma [Desulfobacteraceae bacterium]|nr:MAG: formate dehydrogenase subunit gamma [Desulfobacteraceae bacterium]